MKKFLSVVVLMHLVAMAAAAVPQGRLFQLERSKNKNYVCYDVNLRDNALNTREPLTVYWIRPEEGEVRKELSFLERKVAFGYKTLDCSPTEATVHLMAYDKVKIRVQQRSGKWVATCQLGDKNILISKMYVQLHSPNSIHVRYVDIYGTDIATGASVRERVNAE